MKDENNPNIEYRQISVLLILLFIVYLFLIITAFGFTVLALYSHIHDLVNLNKGDAGSIILFSLLAVYLIYAITVNFIIMFKAYRLKLNDHLVLYTILLHSSLNFICAMMIYQSEQTIDD